MHLGMNLRINFFANPSTPNTAPSPIAYPTGEFASLEAARKIAFADADKPTIMAHSILIESADEDIVSEHWFREGTTWKSPDASRP